ncbi:MAG: glycosyltransferase family 39 protein [Bacteroidetes bacterium]|nr:glycosyltransferase family 39 protein [Bacteroidota bacterium]
MKKNPFIWFLPFLVLYSIYFFLNLDQNLILDDGRYWNCASNIIHGFYADPNTDFGFLWNGPGYPIFLMIFQLLELPFNVAKSFNILFSYVALVYFYKALIFFIPSKRAVIITCLFGLMYPIYIECLPRLQVECFSIMLVCIMCYSILAYRKHHKRKYFWLASISIGYLILTKVFFSYVFIFGFLSLLPMYFISRNKKEYKELSQIVLIGILFTLPYLMFTYSLTGKFPYYSAAGGLSMYWMSTPYENEIGDWLHFNGLPEDHFIKQNHKDFFESIKDFSQLEKDLAYKKKAFENMTNHKWKYTKNYFLNIERLFIMYPTAFQEIPLKEHIIFYFPSVIVFFLLVLAVVLVITRVVIVEPVVNFLLLLIVFYIGLTCLFSAVTRYLYPVIPIVLIFISRVYSSNKKKETVPV